MLLKKYIYKTNLFIRKANRQKWTEILHLMVHSTNVHNIQGGARLKSEVRNSFQASNLGPKNLSTEAMTCCLRCISTS